MYQLPDTHLIEEWVERYTLISDNSTVTSFTLSTSSSFHVVGTYQFPAHQAFFIIIKTCTVHIPWYWIIFAFELRNQEVLPDIAVSSSSVVSSSNEYRNPIAARSMACPELSIITISAPLPARAAVWKDSLISCWEASCKVIFNSDSLLHIV